MGQTAYDAVAKLAEQLPPDEQKALIEHLQEIARQRELSFEEWKAALDSLKIHAPIVGEFSDRRSDWYDEQLVTTLRLLRLSSPAYPTAIGYESASAGFLPQHSRMAFSLRRYRTAHTSAPSCSNTRSRYAASLTRAAIAA